MYWSPFLIAGIAVGILFILDIVVFIICSVRRHKSGDWRECEGLYEGSGILTIFLGLPFVVCLIFGILSTVTLNTEYNRLVHNIVSIRYKDESSGSFFLGCGNIENTLYYYYCYDTPYGYTLGKVEADGTYIVEDDTMTPSLYKIKEKGKTLARYVFYVPTDTIKVYYNVN